MRDVAHKGADLDAKRVEACVHAPAGIRRGFVSLDCFSPRTRRVVLLDCLCGREPAHTL
ncbi:Sua5/YciO/YrdC/YwlC family protein [Burkholderia pseudomallei 305]|nr:hypothetical protein GBP346_A2733 [Burkholderia pseudomallei MSHR346]EBA50986.1 Sua5/YciO/YrdC/YwlC family protein [Burkholderia pseudomallei 305]